MYLSRLILNPHNRAVRGDLADVRQLHRTILRAFPSGPERVGDFRSRHGLLFRLEVSRRFDRPVLLVQSQTLPDWSFLQERGDYLERCPDNPACKSIAPLMDAITEGQVLRFRLRANVTKKIDTKSGPDGKRRNGRRIPLRTPEEQIAWLVRKAEQSGFQLLEVDPLDMAGPPIPDVSIRAERDVHARPACNGRSPALTFGAVVFEGRLRVTDRPAFLSALVSGIGPGKAFGFGLLSVAPT